LGVGLAALFLNKKYNYDNSSPAKGWAIMAGVGRVRAVGQTTGGFLFLFAGLPFAVSGFYLYLTNACESDTIRLYSLNCIV
jgi:hypothetical protein